MTTRKTSWFLAITASLIFGAAAFGQQADQQERQDRQNRQDRSGRSDQSAQGDRQADDAINSLLVQIAQDPKTAADKLFVLTAAIHNQAEIELAREVLQKSQNEQVRRMAQHMIQELQRTHQQLQQTAQAIGLQLPQDLSRAAVQEVHIVAALPSDQIDKQYTARAQADNAQDLSQYQSQGQIAQDAQVRQFAQQQVPGIQQRSRDADQTARGMGMEGQEAQPASGNVPGRGRNDNK